MLECRGPYDAVRCPGVGLRPSSPLSYVDSDGISGISADRGRRVVRAPHFVFTAKGDDATLLLPRDNRVVQHERASLVLQAMM